ncbi:MAG TPA: nuclear transport factor 2 family protein [Eoetvoesiella sp.]
MSPQEQYSPERIADRMAIQDAMYRWCRAVDRLDYEGMRAAFHPDGTDDHGIFSGGVDGLVEWIKERHKKIPFSMHQVSNMLIEFASPDLALVETYVRTVQRYPADATASLVQLSGGQEGTPGVAVDLLTCSRYVDRFERRAGEWRIFRRTLVQDWKQMVEVPENAPKPLDGWTVGSRSKDDPVYRERAELGLSARH